MVLISLPLARAELGDNANVDITVPNVRALRWKNNLRLIFVIGTSFF